MDLLREMGCDAIQGYRLSPALFPSEFSDWLSRYTGSGLAAR